MKVAKSTIIEHIKRIAIASGGVPPGSLRFSSESGIGEREWRGVFWARWGDALQEAGFARNEWQEAYDSKDVLQRYAELAIELDRLPTTSEIEITRRRDPSFPGVKAFRRLGDQQDRLRQLADHCRTAESLNLVVNWCEEKLQNAAAGSEMEPSVSGVDGYVYLIKHGNRREYKIGRTNNPLRREGEIATELPERIQPVHVISTDDPSGIEAYWHNRFVGKRKNGEWFELSAADVMAFKRRKFM